MKKNLFQFLLLSAMLLTGGALVGCGEDVQELADNSNNGETVTETTTGENRTLFTGGGEDTRTSMDTDRKFYWSTGDQIYVNTEGTTYKRTSKSTLTTDKRRADFVLEGVKLTAPNCSVVYIGNGTAAATAEASDLKVKIEDKQRQSAWGNSDHLGASGDCGVAEAIRNETTGKYSFDLTHKASYLIFQPYKDTQITATWKVLKIEIIADGTTLAGEYDFSTGELTNPSGTSSTIEFNCGTDGFTLDNTAASAANSCFAVVQPGQHELTIRYTVQVPGKENVYLFGPDGGDFGKMYFEKKIAARPYTANGVTTIKHKLDFNVLYYEWDAQDPFDATSAAGSYNPIAAPAPAQYTCKDMPNVNEMYWYAVNGNPHWDTTTPWSIDGGLNVYTGGAWFKKKQTILDEGKTFRDDIGKDGGDMRLVATSQNVEASTAVLPAAERSKYFFLPALGRLTVTGSLATWNTYGYYWSSSPSDNGSYAYRLYFYSNWVTVSTTHRQNGYVAGSHLSHWFQ